MATYLGRIQLLAKPASEWAASDPVLMLGEVGVMDAGSSAPVLKVGDGARVYSLLPTITGSGGGGGANDYVAGPTTTLPPGSPATVVIDNASDPPTISFGIPQGVAGPAGATGAPGSPGADGATGPAGPPNALTIGTVTTGAAGSPASATITGTPPNQVLSLTIPQGAEGPQGPQGIQGVKGDTGSQGPAGAGSTPGNPSATIGLAAVNGIASTFLRSDAAPALNQAIAPTWTGAHTWNVTMTLAAPANADTVWKALGAPAHERNWLWSANTAGHLTGYAFADDASSFSAWVDIARIGPVINAVTFPAPVVCSGGGGIDAIVLSGANPVLRMIDTDAPANEKNWRVLANSSAFRIGAVDDALAGTTIALDIVRIGNAISTVNFPSGVLQYGGQEVGFRGLSTRLSSGSPDNLSIVDHGKAFYIQPGTTTLNLPSAALAGGYGLYTIVNNANAPCSLVAGAGTDLTWYSGAGTPVGGTTRTLAGGGVATLSVVGTGWRIWGVGLS